MPFVTDTADVFGIAGKALCTEANFGHEFWPSSFRKLNQDFMFGQNL